MRCLDDLTVEAWHAAIAVLGLDVEQFEHRDAGWVMLQVVGAPPIVVLPGAGMLLVWRASPEVHWLLAMYTENADDSGVYLPLHTTTLPDVIAHALASHIPTRWITARGSAPVMTGGGLFDV